MTEFTIIKELDQEEYECPNPREKSTIIFQVEYVDGDNWGIYDVDHEGGAAAYEASYGIGIVETLKDMLSVKENNLEEGEYYVVENFETYYSQDYYGEVDCDHYIGRVRRASIYDILYFGI